MRFFHWLQSEGILVPSWVLDGIPWCQCYFLSSAFLGADGNASSVHRLPGYDNPNEPR